MVLASAAETGNAILFMACLAATIILGLYVLAYAAHCLLIVVSATASGQDAVAWPDEPVLDWLTQAIQVAYLLALWLVPAGVTARVLRATWLPDQPALRFLAFAVPGLWLFFPVGLLSSLTSVSPWVPLRLFILGRLLRRLFSTLAFYLASAVLGAAFLFPWYLTLHAGMYPLLPVAALSSAALLLVYGRLLGRLTWLISRLPSRSRRSSPPGARKRPRRKRSIALEVEDPWAVSEEKPDPSSGNEDTPSPETAKPRSKYAPPLPHEIEAYGLADEPGLPSSSKPPAPRGAFQEKPPPPPPFPESQARAHREIHLRPRPPEYVPPLPLLTGVYTFPFYGQSLNALIWLALGTLGVGLGLVGMTVFWPS